LHSLRSHTEAHFSLSDPGGAKKALVLALECYGDKPNGNAKMSYYFQAFDVYVAAVNVARVARKCWKKDGRDLDERVRKTKPWGYRHRTNSRLRRPGFWPSRSPRRGTGCRNSRSWTTT
jgi:hypothetical protein